MAEGRMADLIDRQAAIDAVDRYDFKFPQYMERFATDLRDAIKADIKSDLEDLPSAKPERKTGRWVHDGYDYPHGNDWIHCSVCGKRGINAPADLTNFCPNCGAKMEVEDMADLIDRQAAIDALSTPHGILYSIRTVEGLPSVQPERKWIPVTERPPEKQGEYLVTTDGSHNEVIDIALFMSDGWHKASTILAWMPLPEAYKGGEK